METKHLFLSAFIILTISLSAQQVETYRIEKSDLTIKGTSSLHDWEMKAGSVNCLANLIVMNQKVEKIEKVDFVCKTNSLKSEHKLMDTKAHEALRADKYPEIKFSLTTSNISSTSNGELKGEIEGILKLSGVSKKVVLPISGRIDFSDNFKVKGAVKINMTDYNMKPPTAMFGTIVTGEVVEVVYDLTLQNTSATAQNVK
jgi:polyisoprenoid-binding protein YceI